MLRPPAGGGEQPEPDQVICSARGCRQRASWAIVWNNPRIHPPEREKVWTACEEHREYLADYVRRRSMLRRVDPIEQLLAD